MRVFENISRGRAISLFLLVYLVVALYPSLRNLGLPLNGQLVPGLWYTEYNNYIIFKQSFWHLWKGLDLYAAYPEEHYDLFKYTPTFALMFAPFACLPDAMGLVFWNALNVLLPLWALSRLLPGKGQMLLALSLFAIPEVLTSAFNSQSNGLVVGLLLVALGDMQRERWGRASWMIALSATVKLFGILFFALYLLRLDAWKQWAIQAIAALIILLGLPIVLGWDALAQYGSYLDLLSRDHTGELKHSIFAWVQSWLGALGIDPGLAHSKTKTWGLLIGLVIQLIPLMRGKWNQHSLPYAASWLMFMVLFNHMAESASFVIAIMGIVLYLMAKAELNYPFFTPSIRLAMILLLFGTLFGPSDIYPESVREFIVFKAQLKTFPVVVFWVMAWWDSIKKGPHQEAFS
ncbi:MAG: hypothetical protein RL577_1024 [Bacteroidota bacterium]